jgi:hypothetical protein
MTHSRVFLTGLAALIGVSGACSHTPTDDTAGVLGAAAVVETPAPAASSTPSLVVDADGSAYLSWSERRADSSVAIRMAAYTNGVWTTAHTIGENRPFFVNWADFPAVTVLNNGGLAAHWLEREGTGKYAYGIRVVQSHDRGQTWSAPVTPHTDGLEAEHGFVALWPDVNNGVGLVWLDGRKSAMPDSARETTVRTAVVNTDGSLTNEALLDARSCDCCQIASAATARGRVIVYRDRTAEEIRDIVIVRNEGGAWTDPAVVHSDGWHYPGCPVNGPSVVARGDTVAVSWFTAARDTAKVLMAISTDGGANFGPPVRVDDGDPLGRVSMVFDRAGDAIVGWMERRTPETAEVRVRRIHHNTPEPSGVVATTSSARQSGFPRLAVVGDTLLVAWTAVQPALQVRMATVPLRARPSSK